MRRIARTDANQPDIVAGLRAAGVSVEPLHYAGRGVPDLLVGRAGCNYLIEVKAADGLLTPDQVAWHTAWAGQVAVCHTIAEALIAVGLADDPLPIVLQNFWSTLTPSTARGVCPQCEAHGLEVRSVEYRGRRHFYTRHCDHVWEITQR